MRHEEAITEAGKAISWGALVAWTRVYTLTANARRIRWSGTTKRVETGIRSGSGCRLRRRARFGLDRLLSRTDLAETFPPYNEWASE
jgi:hypothetical protein